MVVGQFAGRDEEAVELRSTRFVAMACLIIPRPKKATRISKLLLKSKNVFELDMSGRMEVKQRSSGSV